MTETLTRPVAAEEAFALLGKDIEELMEEHHVPGVAVGVLIEGKEYSAGFGVTNIEHPLPVDDQTLFQIGSTSKTFTGLAIMRLVEQGKIDLDATVRTYIPDLKLADEDVAQRVTVRHLVTHMSGWLGDFFEDKGWGDDSLQKIVESMVNLEQLTPLDSLWSYSNSSFYLLGRIIELVTGKTYEDALAELVLAPLGMKNSFFFARDVMVRKFAVGHNVKNDKPEIARPWPIPRMANAAGGISSTVKDQLIYARFMMGDGTAADGTRILSPESMELMMSPLATAGSFADSVGVTWYIRDVNGEKIVRHGGSTNGQQSAFQFVTSRGFAITVLTNASSGADLHDEAVRRAMRHFLDLDDPYPQPSEATDAELEPYAGTYSMAEADLIVTVDAGKLLVTAKTKLPDTASPSQDPPEATFPPVHLALCGQDQAVATDPPFKNALFEFIRNDTGGIAWIRVSGRLARRTGKTALTPEEEKFEELCRRLEEKRKELGVPGVALGITLEDKHYIRCFGVTNVNVPEPVTADTLFQIGSTTKTFTGTVAMKLVEQGKLDLDAPVRTYLPDLKLQDEAVAAKVTMRHLLTHTGGWAGDIFDDTGNGDDALQKMVESLVDVEQLTPLGTIWSYNNAGFYIAGRVIEAITEKTYEAAVKEIVFDPIGLKSSFFFPEDVISYSFVVGHQAVPGGNGEKKTEVALPLPLARSAHPAGGVSSSVCDQLTYARFHLGDGTAADSARVLSKESMEQMQSPQCDAGESGQMGITWVLRDIEGVRMVSHGGGTNGQISSFDLIPEKKFGMTSLTNSLEGGALNSDVLKWALELYFGISQKEPEPIEASAETLEGYAGRYETPAVSASITMDGDRLKLVMTYKAGFPAKDSPPQPSPPPFYLAPYAADRIMTVDTPGQTIKGEFLRGDDGSIAWLRLGSRIARKVE